MQLPSIYYPDDGRRDYWSSYVFYFKTKVDGIGRDLYGCITVKVRLDPYFLDHR